MLRYNKHSARPCSRRCLLLLTLAEEVARLNTIERFLVLIELVERDEEQDATDERKNAHDTIVPDKQPACTSVHEFTRVSEKESTHGSVESETNASPIALEMAEVKRNMDITSDFMFFGAFVNAYSRPVIDAYISEAAMST